MSPDSEIEVRCMYHDEQSRSSRLSIPAPLGRGLEGLEDGEWDPWAEVLGFRTFTTWN